uniref:Uncharacterized protein n=1 Tax=Panagrolaimus superbus TaxID=310955 RepID=A0A914Y924_9BILA
MFQDEISSANEKLIEENDRIADLKMNVGNFISNSEILLVKAFFIKSAEENGIEYVFQENQLAKLKLKNKKMYICFFTAQNYRNQYNLLRNFVNECCDDDNGRKESDMKYVMIDADILEILVKQELSSESLPRHPLYIFVNNKYQEDPKTKPGHKVTPSYVLLDGDIPIVGDEAKKAKSGQYKNRIYDAKRMLGKKFSHSSIQQGKKCWPFEVRADIHDRPLIHTENYKDKWIYPEQISAFVLERMKQIVENFHLGTKEQITDAVITVPAHFNDAEREATKHAAELAGINVLRLLSEPSAAGLAFCYHKQQFLERSVLVYDLGGGTFDVSVMKINQGHINVQAVGGDSYLGGNDFDDRLLKYCIGKFRILFKENLSTNANAVRRLRNACITAKEHLSGASTYQ